MAKAKKTKIVRKRKSKTKMKRPIVRRGGPEAEAKARAGHNRQDRKCGQCGCENGQRNHRHAAEDAR